MKYTTIIFDFDGVILESVSVKTEAFRTLFSFVPDHVEEIVQFHINNGGMSRFDKFRYIYKNILKEELSPQTFEILSEKFSAIVLNKVINAPFVPGAYEFLENYHRKILLYVVSATPEEELITIIQKRGLARYFQKIFGAPRKKAECIIEILKLSESSEESILFVGDAKNDYDAARSTGIHFIGRIAGAGENRFAGLSGVDEVITDLFELARYIEVNS
jgi:beta-phosphoglucomutase